MGEVIRHPRWRSLYILYPMTLRSALSVSLRAWNLAFGLKALIAFFEWPEEKPLEELEEKIKALENVSSIQVIDMRKIA